MSISIRIGRPAPDVPVGAYVRAEPEARHKLARAFGVLAEGGAARRATFILDPAGVVRHALVNDHDVGRNLDETLRTLRALRTGEPCPAGWQLGDPTLRYSLAGGALLRSMEQPVLRAEGATHQPTVR